MALGDKVRSQDSVHFIGSVAARRQGRDLAWQFFKDKFVFIATFFEKKRKNMRKKNFG